MSGSGNGDAAEKAPRTRTSARIREFNDAVSEMAKTRAIKDGNYDTDAMTEKQSQDAVDQLFAITEVFRSDKKWKEVLGPTGKTDGWLCL